MISAVDEFLPLYENRPVKKNPGGMGLNHSFAVWFLIRKAQPDLVVESGVLRGHSTWLIELAAPTARILCFDTSFKLLEFRARNAHYFEGDLRSYSWANEKVSAQSIALLDDHQNAYRRIIDLAFFGFRQFIVEDNYPVGEGDFYSLQHMAAGVRFTSQQMSQATKAKMKRAKRKDLEKKDAMLMGFGLDQNRLVQANTVDWPNLSSRSEVIETIPPVALEPLNRWGHPHEGRYATPEPLLSERDFSDQNLNYNWVTYLRLKAQAK